MSAKAVMKEREHGTILPSECTAWSNAIAKFQDVKMSRFQQSQNSVVLNRTEQNRGECSGDVAMLLRLGR